MSKAQCWEQRELSRIEAARRETGFCRGGYGAYVAAGMPGYDPDKPFTPAGGGKKIRRADTDGIARNGRRCIVCGAPLRGTQRKFCGPICRYGYRQERAAKERAAEPRVCALCGGPLGERRKGAKYCSKVCYRKACWAADARKRKAKKEEGST